MIFAGLAGSEVKKILSRDKQVRVEMIGEKAVYLRTEKDDVVVFTRNPFTPYGISFNDDFYMLRKNLSAKSVGFFNGSRILFNDGLSVEFMEDERTGPLNFTGMMNKAVFPCTYKGYKLLLSDLDQDEVINRGVKILNESEAEEVLLRLLEIIGLGTGYTPTGDDFVSGVMLALLLMNMTFNPQPVIKSAVELSRWPSWKMVEHASHGCTFRPIYNLCKTLVAGGDTLQYVLETARIGGTTGLATLCGLLETLKIFSKELI